MNPVATRDAAQAAEASVKTAEDRERLAQAALDDAKAAREQAARDAAVKAKEAERSEQTWKLDAGNQVRQLKKQVEAMLADVSHDDRPAIEARGLSRAWLYGLDELSPVHVFQRLCEMDVRLGQLIGASRACAAMMAREGTMRDATITAALDELECKCWAAGMRRVRVLAGEDA